MKPEYLQLYDMEQYWCGEHVFSGYDDYASCRGVMFNYAGMLDRFFSPQSVLDVGAAYGFVVEYFQKRGIEVAGIEPSAFARQKAAENGIVLQDGYLPDLSVTQRAELVTCTEVLEHLPVEDIPAALTALGAASSKWLVLMPLCRSNAQGDLPTVSGVEVMHRAQLALAGTKVAGDIGHITVMSVGWWEQQLAAALPDFARDDELHKLMNHHFYSEKMRWNGRMFVLKRQND